MAFMTLSFLYLLWTKWLRVRIESKKPFPDLPMFPSNHFFWGHLRYVFKLDFDSATRMADEVSNEYGLLGYWVFGQRSFWATHWEDARAVLLATDFRTLIFIARYHIGMAFGPRNILLLKGRAWKFHRTAILKSLVRITNGTQQQQAVAQVTNTLIASLHRKFQDQSEKIIVTATDSSTCLFLEMDIEPLMKMVTIDVFGKTALSTNFSCCEHLAPSPLASAFDFVGAELTRRIRSPMSIASYWYNLPTPLNRKHYECRKILRTFLSELIQQRRQENKTATSTSTTTSTGNRDLLSLLIQANDDAKGKSEEDDTEADQTLGDVLMSLFFAGYDTTSICLTYAFYLLASHPVEQKYCYHEAKRLLIDTVELSNVNLDDLVFCKAVILEALRLFPPAFLVNRAVEKDLPLRGGFVAPPGSNAVVSIWTLQRLEHNFPCPNDFRPDRWVKQQQQSDGVVQWVDRSEHDDATDMTGSSIPPGNLNAMLAFSAGSRSCPGQKFATQEAILVLAGLVKEFEFQLVPGYELQPVRRGLVQGPKGGLPLRIQPRQSSSVMN